MPILHIFNNWSTEKKREKNVTRIQNMRRILKPLLTESLLDYQAFPDGILTF